MYIVVAYTDEKKCNSIKIIKSFNVYNDALEYINKYKIHLIPELINDYDYDKDYVYLHNCIYYIKLEYPNDNLYYPTYSKEKLEEIKKEYKRVYEIIKNFDKEFNMSWLPILGIVKIY